MKKAILRYGVILILVIMSAGLVIILNSLSIRQKTAVQLFVTGTQGAKAYTLPTDPSFKKGDTIEITQTTGGNIYFMVDSTYSEGNGQVFLLTQARKSVPLRQRLKGNSYTQGYVLTGRVPLLRLVLKKMQ